MDEEKFRKLMGVRNLTAVLGLVVVVVLVVLISVQVFEF